MDLFGPGYPSFGDNPTSSGYYRCKVTCITSGLYSYSSPVYVATHTTITAHNVTGPSDSSCSLNFYVATCGFSSSLSVTTFYGDGSSDNVPLSSGPAGYYANLSHTYTTAGHYTIKHILYIGTVPQDSVTFSYEYLQCGVLPLKFYLDANSDCVFDSGDKIMSLPVLAKIDSNGVTIDTLSVDGGAYYKASGPAGTIYKFTVISTPGGILPTCPASSLSLL